MRILKIRSQVGIAFAQSYISARPYPYVVEGTVRDEVFTVRGGIHFGVAHLPDYPAPYDRVVYRFADYDAGRFASHNAAFQNAVTQASGIALVLDGDLLGYRAGEVDAAPSATQLALRTLAGRLGRDAAAMARDLQSRCGAEDRA